MGITNDYVFNFAASYSSGGLKRLIEYAKWFSKNGGAWFVIHPLCADLIDQYPNNRYFVAKQSRFKRLYDDCGYLPALLESMGAVPELYYSYGIPLYSRFGRINWFHLSNVLPIQAKGIPISLTERLTFYYLGWRFRRGFRNADVISAESNSSLHLLDGEDPRKLFLSVNGSDDELSQFQDGRIEGKENVVTVVGTHRYKALGESFRLFQMLKEKNSLLKLIILGNEHWVPKSLRDAKDVIVPGMIPRPQVIDYLRKTKIYISTTLVENSYNAASEAIVFADESYISDIGPHRELLLNMPFDRVQVPGVSRPLLHVKREDLSGANLKTWDAVVLDMIARFREASGAISVADRTHS
jgi:hypothetical protein